MGQIDSRREERAFLQDLPQPKLEALIEIMYLAAMADGDFGMEERAHFQTSVETLTDRRLEGHALGELIARFERELEASSRGGRLERAKEHLTDVGARKVALALAIRMMSADHVIRTSERELILELAETLGVDRGDAADLVREIAG